MYVIAPSICAPSTARRHVARALVRHVGRLDAERRVQALVRGMVGRVQARAAEVQLARVGLGRLDEVGEGLDRALLGHHQVSGV